MYFVHNLDPVVWHIWGPMAIRWYGLAYIGGLIAGYFLLDRWGRAGRYPLQGEQLQSLLMSLVIGILVGGRLGEFLFYDMKSFLANPLVFFRLWEGGMSSHGGMIGCVVAVWIASRKLKVPILRLGDGLCAVAPIGIGFGRLANFINGELWGRPTSVSWAVIFPQEAGLDPTAPGIRDIIPAYLERGLVYPRHPSQLYEAALEGVLLGLILLWVYRSKWAAEKPGFVSGLFFALYAAFRVAVEYFREPDRLYWGWLSQGQLLSVVVLLPIAAVLFWLSARAQKNR